jgi:hypothetical protein
LKRQNVASGAGWKIFPALSGRLFGAATVRLARPVQGKKSALSFFFPMSYFKLVVVVERQPNCG